MLKRRLVSSGQGEEYGASVSQVGACIRCIMLMHLSLLVAFSLCARGWFTLYPCYVRNLPQFSELRFFYQEGASHLFPEAW